jgi:DNA-binding response OmpR family regulator
MADIVLVRWPEERAEATRLVRDGVPVLYLIAGEGDLPTITTCIEDWVRVPGDDWELSARMLALQRRATAHRAPPSIDDTGRLRFNGKVVRLDPADVALASLLADHLGALVTDAELATRLSGGEAAVTPGFVRTHVSHLRTQVREVGLRIERIRRSGYALREG